VSRLRAFFNRVSALLRSDRIDRELDDEIAAHVAEAAEDYVRRGFPPAEAQRAALRDFGGVTRAKELHRDVRSLRWLEDTWRDLRYGGRLLLRSPGFAVAAVSSLALGIGANTALFSVTDALMFKMLPVSRPEHLVRVRTPLSFPAFRTVRDHNRTLAGMFAYSVFPASVRIRDDADVEQAVGQMVTEEFYSVLGVKAVRGRALSRDDVGPIAVISYAYWQRRFALDPAAIGQAITLNGVSVTIVGVTPPGFFGVIPTMSPDITVPVALQPSVFPSTSTELWAHGDEGSFLSYDLTDAYGPAVMARLKPGVRLEQAEAELTVMYQQILSARNGATAADRERRQSPEQRIVLVPAGNGSGTFEPQARALMLLVMTAVPALVLLIACVNVATLLLARAAARQREIAARLSLGAGRGRVVRQLLSESLVLALAGGAAGLLLAGWTRRVLLAWIAAHSFGFFALQAATDMRTLLFTMAASVAAALLFGLIPAVRATKMDLAATLKATGRTVAGARGWDLGKVMIAAQVAISILLLVCAGLLVRSVRNLQFFDPGFDREQLFLLHTSFLGYKGPQTGTLVKEVWNRTASLPGARAVGIAQDVPPAEGADRRLNVTVEGMTGAPQEEMYVDRLMIGPGFFDVMGVPLLAGRAITARDDEDAPKVCVISSTVARAFFADRSPIGRHFTFTRIGAEYEVEIVGVAKDLKKADPRGEWRLVYCPMLQDLPTLNVVVLVRAQGDPQPVIAAAREQILSIDKNLFIDVTTMDRRMEDNFFFQRLLATIASAFGLLALLLASIGLYGVMAYSVARRTNEVGIRMALGADRRRVIATVVCETLTVVAAGVLIGLAATWGATRLIASTLFGVTSMDPMTLAFAIAVMTMVALLAGYIPARRAAAVDPVVALRQD